MGRKNLLADLVESASEVAPQEMGVPPPPLLRPTLGSRGAVGAMSRSLEQLSADRDAAQALSERLANGQSVVEIDTGLVEDSLVPDRMAGSDADHAALVESIRAEGQIVPALLRPHPQKPNRFQIAYGHRRIRALRELGRPVRAVVRALTDDELVIAQGKENGDRQDLSFIERARYAALLEERQFRRETIMAALSVDKTELSRLISTARAIPATLADRIGRAPKIGRRRWMDLAERLGKKTRGRVLDELFASKAFLRAESDDRFVMVFAALAEPARPVAKPATWVAGDGRRIARIERRPDRFLLTLDENLAPRFGDFLLDNLPALYDQFRAAEKGRGGDA